MMLASIRRPVVLVEQLDHLAASQGVRRSDIVREALTTYVVDQTAPVGRDEATGERRVRVWRVSSLTVQPARSRAVSWRR